ncbi:hypothetical protein QCE63_33800 [Caballeronia sp. LZ065]|uniref:hypothetical protein n=1 Tax=Caballeronia sp. LZ065 TaxID=3038571 RepID=UPI00286377D7|nr:hypothetical protein [Caballeronia sp. LZ065]MDR5784399.1 hypothetical protein [Caballeronia sp. LZ065]
MTKFHIFLLLLLCANLLPADAQAKRIVGQQVRKPQVVKHHSSKNRRMAKHQHVVRHPVRPVVSARAAIAVDLFTGRTLYA